MGIRISSLSANALPYTGREQIPLVQNATTRAGTLSSFVNYLSGDFAFVNRPNTFIGNQTIQGNLSVQRTLSATSVEAVSGRFDFVDIKQFEASGFDIKGNLNVLGALSATNNVTLNNGLTAGSAVLFDVNTSAPALEIVQRGSGFSLLVEDEANDTTPFVVTGEGNVGVGTSTPNEKLTVFGNLSVSGSLSASMIEAISSKITYLDIIEYELSGFRATGPVIIETNSDNTTLRITQSGTGDVIRVEDSVNPDTTPLIIKSDGKVGIGVTAPNELLTVAGNISAYGNIYAFNTLSTPTGNSINWDNTYSSVNTLSSTWDRGYTAYNGVTALSANWQSVYTTMTANSASWNTVYSTVCSQSANWNRSNIFDISNTTVLLALSDSYDYIRLTNASPITIQIPILSWNIGTEITFRRTTSAGAITLSAGTGVTVNDDDSASILAGDTFIIKYISSNTWDFI